jgi:hypothetical protein
VDYIRDYPLLFCLMLGLPILLLIAFVYLTASSPEKPKSKKILEYLEKGWTLREIAKQVDASTKTVMKVKSTATKLQMI